jgi:hypothetical protein
MKDPPANDGRPLGWVPTYEGDHYAYCERCRQWFDLRKLSDVMEHNHNAPFDTGGVT